ncbi:MAG: type II secretion system protein [Kiritimatiellae bacterium]|nr:type II secretion system protein [Kiritimatiellia bacterium]
MKTRAQSVGHGGNQGFTLLELLVAISVLAVLFAIVLPSIRAARTAALKRRAQADATALAQAAIRYKGEYGFWPGQVVLQSPSDKSVRLHTKTQSSLGANGFLSCIISAPASFLENFNTSSGSGNSTQTGCLELDTNEVYRCFARVNMQQATQDHQNPLNPKGISFIELSEELDWNRVYKKDPWDNPYILIMGLNPRSSFFLRNKVTGSIITAASNVTAMAFSMGPPELQYTNYLFSAGVAK